MTDNLGLTDTPWWTEIPAMRTMSNADSAALQRSAQQVSVPALAPVFRAGDLCSSYLIVVEGSVRVSKAGDNGREIVLYRVKSGETCPITTSCLLASERYPADAVAETPVRAIALSSDAFTRAMALVDFRTFVFSGFGRRLADLMTLIEAIALHRTDGRLALSLLQKSTLNDEVAATHYQLATELGTAREVISRLLAEFENRGWIRRGRGVLYLVDRRSLEDFAAESR